MTPWAKFKIPMMLKRKVNPNPSKIYIDESIKAFRKEATRSNIVGCGIYDSLSLDPVKPGGNISPGLK
jgi:hypothetical protein